LEEGPWILGHAFLRNVLAVLDVWKGEVGITGRMEYKTREI
jgi:hypothetical protein